MESSRTHTVINTDQRRRQQVPHTTQVKRQVYSATGVHEHSQRGAPVNPCCYTVLIRHIL